MTIDVNVTHDAVDFLTVAGTVGAAVVAALAVRQTGRQGAEQRQLLIDARDRDVAERRVDFELTLLLELAELGGRLQDLQGHAPGGRSGARARARALLMALPEDSVPTLNAWLQVRASPGAVTAYKDGPHEWPALYAAVAAEVETALQSRRNLDAPCVSKPLARRSWKTGWLVRRLAKPQVRSPVPASPGRSAG